MEATVPSAAATEARFTGLASRVIIILEGPDGGGKTTLARELAELLRLEYRHEGPPPPNVNVLHHYGRLLDDARGKNVVFDRLALGERIYGPLLRGEDRLGVGGWEIFHRLVTAVDAFEVLCLPSLPVCLTNWRAKTNDLLTNTLQVETAWAGYAHLHGVHESLFDQWVFDYTRAGSFDALVCQLSAHQNTSQALPAQMIGSPYARTLFVGEQVGDVTGLDLPFFTDAGSAAYLWRAIELARLQPERIAFINAFDRHGAPNPLPQFERIVALGRKAEDRCEKAALVQVVGVPHPQYWKRFKHHAVNEYARIIHDAAQVACL